MTGQLQAGASRATITPPPGVDMTGFAGRAGPNEGVNDDLRGCALYLSLDGQELLMLTADLIGLHHEEVARIREGVLERTGVPPEAVMVSCSHTHSGPATRCINALGHQDEAYLEELVDKMVRVAVAARNDARPAQAAAGRHPVQVGVNRRAMRDHGIVLGVNVDGPTDPAVTTLYVDDADGRPLARLFSHAAHPVTLGPSNLLISGDWAGYAQRAVEMHYGAECVALFMQGCCGDINCHLRESFEFARQQGETLAAAVIAGDDRETRTQDPVLGASSETLQLPAMPPPSPEEARRMREQFQADAEATRESDNYGMRLYKDGLVEWADRLVQCAEGDRGPGSIPFEVQALRVGNLGIVGLPGEVFVEYALNIRGASPLPLTAVCAYANGNVGYIPTAAAYEEGGYEVDSAIRFYGLTMPVPESEQMILAAAQRQLARVAGPVPV